MDKFLKAESELSNYGDEMKILQDMVRSYSELSKSFVC